jgi:hypothetical protein
MVWVHKVSLASIESREYLESSNREVVKQEALFVTVCQLSWFVHERIQKIVFDRIEIF